MSRPRQGNHLRQAGQTVVGQRGVGSLQRHVGTAAHGDADGRRFHRRGVVDAVADHRQRRIGIQRHHRFDFVRRQQAGAEFQPQFAGDGRRGARVIPGEDHPLHPQLV